MLGFAAGFLKNPSVARDDDGVGGADESRVRGRGNAVRDGGLVDVEAFLVGGREDVVEGPVVGFGEVFGLGGGQDFDVCEADLGWVGVSQTWFPGTLLIIRICKLSYAPAQVIVSSAGSQTQE